MNLYRKRTLIGGMVNIKFLGKITMGIMLSVFLFPQLFGETPDTLWTKTFGGYKHDMAYSVQETKDGGFIVTGMIDYYGTTASVLLLKLDMNGSRLWSKTFGGSGRDEGTSVRQTSDGGYIIVGITDSYGFGDCDVYLIKTDPKGNLLWQRTFGGKEFDSGKAIQQTSDGGYIITGVTNSFGAVGNDIYLLKTDAKGNCLWFKTYGEENHDHGNAVQQTSDGGYIIVGQKGFTEKYGTSLWLLRTTASGDTIWTKQYHGTDAWDQGNSIQKTLDGGYIITGYKNDNYDLWLLKTDSKGNLLWQKTFGGSSHEEGESVQQTSDGGYIIAGCTKSYGEGDADVWIIKTDALGETIWRRTYGGSHQDYGHEIQETSDGGFIIAGYTHSYGIGLNDFYVLKMKPFDHKKYKLEIDSISLARQKREEVEKEEKEQQENEKEEATKNINGYREIVNNNPGDAEAHYNLGHAYCKLEQWQAAIASLQKATKIKSNYPEAYYWLGAAYYNLGHYEEAIKPFKNLIKIAPDSAGAYRGLGLAYGNLGDHKKAIEYLKQAIISKPDFMKAYLDLGVAYIHVDQEIEAIESFKQAIHINPDYADAHYRLGGVYMMIGNREAAIEEYRILKNLDRDFASKLYRIIYK